jgi:hypothetical protein
MTRSRDLFCSASVRSTCSFRRSCLWTPGSCTRAPRMPSRTKNARNSSSDCSFSSRSFCLVVSTKFFMDIVYRFTILKKLELDHTENFHFSFSLTGTYIYLDPPQNISFPKLTLPKIAFPSITLPDLSLNLSWPSWLKLPSFSFEWLSFSLPNLSLNLSWPSWLKLPSFSFEWLSFSLPDLSLNLSWPSWLKSPSFSLPKIALPSISLPNLSLNLSWPSWLKLPSFSLPSWFRLPSFSFSLPDFSFVWIALPSFAFERPSWPEWLRLPEFSLSEMSWLKFPTFSLPSISFEFLNPIATFTSDSFSSLKLSTIEVFDKIRDATTGALNEAQIVWNENFNAN